MASRSVTEINEEKNSVEVEINAKGDVVRDLESAMKEKLEEEK